jgi:hypothetical protein
MKARLGDSLIEGALTLGGERRPTGAATSLVFGGGAAVVKRSGGKAQRVKSAGSFVDEDRPPPGRQIR